MNLWNLYNDHMFPFVSQRCLGSNPQASFFFFAAFFTAVSCSRFAINRFASIDSAIFTPKSRVASLSLSCSATSYSCNATARLIDNSSPLFGAALPPVLSFKWLFMSKYGLISSQLDSVVLFPCRASAEHWLDDGTCILWSELSATFFCAFSFAHNELSSTLLLCRATNSSGLQNSVSILLARVDLMSLIRFVVDRYDCRWRRSFSAENLSHVFFEMAGTNESFLSLDGDAALQDNSWDMSFVFAPS